jgi:hypothetical protein
MKNLRINRRYFIAATILFVIEVGIAWFVHDSFVRPYLGDVLVVILIYCAVKSVVNWSVWPTAVGVLLFAFAVEAAQYFGLIYYLGLENSGLARAVIGTSFAWADIVAYCAGIALVLLVETRLRSYKS